MIEENRIGKQVGEVCSLEYEYAGVVSEGMKARAVLLSETQD